MGLTNIYDNPLLTVDAYYFSTWYLKKNMDWEVAHLYNRTKPMILYGFNESVRHLLNRKITVDLVMEAEEKVRQMGLVFPVRMWMDVVDKLKGWVPLRVQALPDGSYVPKGTPFAQIENTEEGFGEIAFWFETLLMHSYFPSSCATEALQMRRYLEKKKLPLTRFHSFGHRGHRSQEDAYWASTAWSLFLPGTDDAHVKMHIGKGEAKSISATAHKVIQQFDNELEAYYYAIDATREKGKNIVALVIDTYDPIRFIHEYSQKVALYAKERNMHVVFRPDSGDVVKQTIDLYRKMYAHGFDNTSVIIGEGMSFRKAKLYDKIFQKEGVPLSFFSFGIGSGFYNHLNRDTLGWAMKCAYSNGSARMKLVKSNPIKQSIPGQVNLVRDEKGNLVVEYTRDGLYVDIYHYDERSSRPKTFVEKWEDIQERALNEKTTQKKIIISPLVKEKIKELEQKYLGVPIHV